MKKVYRNQTPLQQHCQSEVTKEHNWSIYDTGLCVDEKMPYVHPRYGLYVPRIADSAVAQTMADIEKPYRESKRLFGLLGASATKILQGQIEAEEYLLSELERREVNMPLVRQLRQLLAKTADTQGQTSGYYVETIYFEDECQYTHHLTEVKSVDIALSHGLEIAWSGTTDKSKMLTTHNLPLSLDDPAGKYALSRQYPNNDILINGEKRDIRGLDEITLKTLYELLLPTVTTETDDRPIVEFTANKPMQNADYSSH